MPTMDVPMETGNQMMIERRVGNSGNRGLSPITPDINKLLKEQGLTARERAKLLNDWANELGALGRLAMDDPNLAARLGMVLAPAEFRTLYRDLGKTYSGDKLWEAVIEAKIKRTREMGCFVAGTLVHTKEGLKPIEQIKVGDLVLTKPENGEGELSYQPVTRTFVYENREVYYVKWGVKKEESNGESTWSWGEMAVTGGHPIWVRQLVQWKGKKAKSPEGYDYVDINAWMSIDELYLRMWKNRWTSSKLAISRVHAMLADGSVAVIGRIEPILQSLGQAHIQLRNALAEGRYKPNPLIDEFLQIPYEDVGVAFSDEAAWREESSGDTIIFGPSGAYQSKDVKRGTNLGPSWVDTDDHDYTGYDTESPMSVVKRSGGHLPMRRTVYNLEVANTHSYFVGELGLWVHNTSGVDASKLPLNPSLPLGVFIGTKAETEFLKMLRASPDGRGVGILPDIKIPDAGTYAQQRFHGSVRDQIGEDVLGDQLFAYTLGYKNTDNTGQTTVSAHRPNSRHEPDPDLTDAPPPAPKPWSVPD